MPWSAKAQELLQKQYAPVGNAGVRALMAESDLISQAMLRVSGLEELSRQTAERLIAVEHYSVAHRQYCWPVNSLTDLRLAPFHLLASEGSVHTDKPHTWHMDMIGKLSAADKELLFATPFQIVDLQDGRRVANAASWWTEMTSRGGGGIVVKPVNFIPEDRRGLTQPAIQCRGRITCGSFTGRSICCMRTSKGCAHGMLVRSVLLQAASSRLELKRWNDLFARNLCGYSRGSGLSAPCTN
jgi:protein phosphatase